MTTNTTTKNVLRIAAAAVLLLLLFCGVFCGAAGAAAGADTSGLPTSGDLQSKTYVLTGDVELTNALYVPNGVTATIDLAGHTIKGEFPIAKDTSSIVVNNGGRLILEDSSKDGNGKITRTTGNRAYGNCVYIHSGGMFTMNGGTLNGIDTGVYVYRTVIMNKGTISSSLHSGGVNVLGGTFVMNGGAISYNCAGFETEERSTGGGVYVDGGMFTMNGGLITGNTASHASLDTYKQMGGGVYVKKGTFEMTGGNIIGNAAAHAGGGVYVCKEGRFLIRGTPMISSNTGQVHIYASNVYLESNSSLILTGPLTKDASIWIKFPDNGQFGIVDPGYTPRYTDMLAFHNELSGDIPAGCGIQMMSSRPILWVKEPGSMLIRYGAYFYDQDSIVGGLGSPFTRDNAEYNKDTRVLKLKDTITIDNSENTLDVFAQKSNGKQFTIDLNGHALQGINGGKWSLITVEKDAWLTVIDSSSGKTGKITRGNAENGGGVYVKKGTFTLDGVCIVNNSAKNGGGVYVDDGTFTMNNSSIDGNTATGNGGGVYVYSGSSTMNNSSIIDNSAEKGGGVYINDGKFFLNSGTIEGNKAVSGGGAHVAGGDLNMTGGTITQNTATENGGGVYGHLKMSGGSITGNDSKIGGGVLGGLVQIEGTAVIKDNTNGSAPSNLHIYLGSSEEPVFFWLNGPMDASADIRITYPVTGKFGIVSPSYMYRVKKTDLDAFHPDTGNFTVAIQDELYLYWEEKDNLIRYGDRNYGTEFLIGGDGSPFTTENAEYNVETGTLTLTNTVTLDYTLEVIAAKENPFTIDLNGCTLQAKSGTGVNVITVAEKAGLILKDSVGGGKITGGNAAGGKATRGGGVYVSRNGTFIMESGSITNNYAIRGGGVYLDDNSDFEMNGGSITNNTAKENGGGVYVDDSTFSVRGESVVKGNTGLNSANNVYTSKPLIITTNGLSGDKNIGITCGISPDEGRFVDVTTPTLADSSKYFFSDNPSVYELTNADVSGGYVVRLIPMQYTVTYDLNGGSGSTPTDSKKYHYNAEVTVADKPADMKREGFTFMGWNTAADGKGQDYKPGSTLYLKGDTTLYANWKEGAKYSVIVKSAGKGNAGVKSDIAHEVPAGTLIQGGVIPKSGYKFDHWEAVGIDPTDITCTTPSGKGTFSFSFTMPAHDVTLTAYFTEKTQANDAVTGNTFNVTYDAGGGSGTPPVDNNSYSEGDSVTVLSPDNLTRGGYIFFCWEELIDIDIDGDENPDRIRLNYWPGDTFEIYHNTTLSAVWKENEEEYLHDIMLLTSGHGTVSSDPAQAAKGTTVQVNVTADDGYYFVGWKDFKGITAIPGNSNPYSFIMPDSDVEVTAVFAKNQTKLPVADGAVMFDEEVTSGEAKEAGIDVEFAGVFGIPNGTADEIHIGETTTPLSGADIRLVLAMIDITPYEGEEEVHEFTSPVTIAFNVILPNGYSINNLAAEHSEGNEWKTIPHWALESDGEYIIGVNAQNFSPFALVLLNEEQPEQSSSSSRDYGASVWLPATTEPTPTAEATPEPTLAQPAASPVNQPPQQTSTPVPAAGIIAGLGAALVFGVRRK